jgi:flavin reductase (DIM6/NTAB) family NADH-FMN oxidoreductase RutF
MDQRYRGNLINAIHGFKSANLIATVSKNGVSNVALFSSVIHLGANPPLIGFIQRPVNVQRDTYENIIATGSYTINHVHSSFYPNAHATSARFDKSVSEFKACKLTEEYLENFPVPYVGESMIKIGMTYEASYPIPLNNTILIAGSVQVIHINDNLVADDGDINLNQANDVCISGLYTYHKPVKLAKLPYAKAINTPT